MKGLICLQEIDLNETKESHKYFIWNFYDFLNINFRFHVKVSNVCDGYISKNVSFIGFTTCLLVELIIEFCFCICG